MKVFALLALATVAMSLPGYAESEDGQLEARIYCPGRKPPICITKREVTATNEESGEVETQVGGCKLCITKRLAEVAEAIEAKLICPGVSRPWCITKREE
ncbi:hypothetical protein B0J11DRAFT_545739 [Dendryphion nanum]|uniref:Uncharacterized protein n=1 Tax=Dendryphion nanum TaxID=256645 RepID=A0A9P9I6W5_9PLEO|nr:hypothetical protein B0J11DRAFT_545739 [Dendryphion nanum]